MCYAYVIARCIEPQLLSADNNLAQGCKVTAHDIRPNPLAGNGNTSLHCLQGNISDEESIADCIALAVKHHKCPVNILCANAGITDESNNYPIWEMPTELWDRTYNVNVRGTYLTIKHFLKYVDLVQRYTGEELPNVSIIVTGSECGVFGQAGHVEYASGKAGLQYGLVRTVKNEIVRLNGKARINAVAPGWVDTKLIEGRLDDPKEMWREAEATSVDPGDGRNEALDTDYRQCPTEEDCSAYRCCKSSSLLIQSSSCRSYLWPMHINRWRHGRQNRVV